MPKVLGFDAGFFGYDHYASDGSLIFFEVKGEDIEMMSIQRDIDTNEATYKIKTEKYGQDIFLTIPERDAKDGNRLMQYASKGLDIGSDNKNLFPAVFREKESQYIQNGQPIVNAYSIPGVKEVVIGDPEILLETSKTFCGEQNPHTGDVYCGFFDLSAKGKSDDYINFLKKEIAGCIPLEFAVMVAVAAILHGYLADENVSGNFIIHLVGDSSTGKSTAMQLAISTMGNPSMNIPNGLISTWNATQNALLKRLMNVKGMLFGMDELSMSNIKNITSVLYAICQGVEKDRLTRNAETQARETGNYILMSTGESGLLSRANSNLGLRMRVLEFRRMAWTESAEQCERIQKFISENYGTFAMKFGCKMAFWLIKHGIKSLVERYAKWRDYYCKVCDIQARKERISGRYGLILLAGEMLNEFFDLGFHTEKVCEFIVDNENNIGDDRDSYNDVYDRIVSFINANIGRFLVEKSEKITNSAQNGEVWGKIVLVKKEIKIGEDYACKKVLIRTNIFERELLRMGEEDPKTIISFLKRKGYLDFEAGRNTRTVKIDGSVKEKVYAIYLLGNESPLTEKEQKEREVLHDEFCKLSAKEQNDIKEAAVKVLPDDEEDATLREFNKRKKKQKSQEHLKGLLDDE